MDLFLDVLLLQLRNDLVWRKENYKVISLWCLYLSLRLTIAKTFKGIQASVFMKFYTVSASK